MVFNILSDYLRALSLKFPGNGPCKVKLSLI
jgi:hypothetical protein